MRGRVSVRDQPTLLSERFDKVLNRPGGNVSNGLLAFNSEKINFTFVRDRRETQA